jgi:arginyl-tRNA synthetase
MINDSYDYLALTQTVVQELFPQADPQVLILENPKDMRMGDLAVPMFGLAKVLRMAPPVLAQQICAALQQRHLDIKVQATGAYVNFFMDKNQVITRTLQQVLQQQEQYGHSQMLNGKKVMIEFSGPNTNKPLHLGHLRNNTLGESLSRILAACGAHVVRVNIINDRGVHICKSMLAYQMFGQGKTPESEGIKSDHFVGSYYVQYAQWAKDHPEGEAQVQNMLNQWEDGDADIHALWQKMNHWALSGMQQTYDRTGIHFDKLYFESETYKLGKDIIHQGLDRGVFQRADDGSLVMDISAISHQETDEPSYKVFLRKDGTSVYITQDLGTAIKRHEDYQFDQLIYVVANEQKRHFEILFYALQQMGYPWAHNLYHLSYGMVNLPDGKMKSREGTVVDADNLLDELERLAQEEMHSKENLEPLAADTAFKVGLGALHYYLLHTSPYKDMLYDSKASLSFNGATGPYLQYSIARINSLLRKSNYTLQDLAKGDYAHLTLDDEWQLTLLLAKFEDIIQKCAVEYAPHYLANHLYDIAKTFSKYYHDVSILSEPDESVRRSRLALVVAVGYALRSGLQLLNMPVLERM